ncbi:hypothetical protein [uncultured Desulfovibrio sp.]|uniref:hypothetical protein n=1 Tax=uncultured Desulfovibrio sp. TaxID=167968 RepID=UPI00261E1381|nr:hypothetical protein [uncultured Desulfovibrio sp.]
MATRQRISAELGRMAIAYRQPIDGKDEFPLLVETWADLCGGIPDEDFTAACKLHMCRSKFFPCPADVIAAHEECRPVRHIAALPQEPEHKTHGLGGLVFAAFRGDPAARAKVEQFRQQSRKAV